MKSKNFDTSKCEKINFIEKNFKIIDIKLN